jgi:hypothetical protein
MAVFTAVGIGCACVAIGAAAAPSPDYPSELAKYVVEP